MRKTKLTIKIISLTLAVIFPFLLIFSVVFFTEPEYDDSFVGILDEKLDRLYGTEGEKIVIIGCSSAAFGYDSEIIEKYLERPVINMGIYAALGTKLMLDLSKDAIGEGDIVIIAPELDSQTLSLYFDPDTALRALDGSPRYLFDIPKEHRASLLGASFEFASEKLSYKLSAAPSFDGIYSSKSFNERGDIGVYRAENTMFDYYDSNVKIRLNADIIEDEFIDYLNEYAGYCASVGASIYFEFCPMNRLGFDGDSKDASARLDFERQLRKMLDFPVIASSIEDYVYNEGYFYDSNLHLNSAGVINHTLNVTRDLLLELGINKAITDLTPPPPQLPEKDVRYFGDDENSVYFNYEKMQDGAYTIVGVKEEYLDEKTLTVPLGYQDYKVTKIAANAFVGSSVETLIVTADTNLRAFDNGAFDGAGSLKALYMYYSNCNEIEPPRDFNGVNEQFKVYVPENSEYETDAYGWGDVGLDFEYIYD